MACERVVLKDVMLRKNQFSYSQALEFDGPARPWMNLALSEHGARNVSLSTTRPHMIGTAVSSGLWKCVVSTERIHNKLFGDGMVDGGQLAVCEAELARTAGPTILKENPSMESRSCDRFCTGPRVLVRICRAHERHGTAHGSVLVKFWRYGWKC